MQSKIPYGASGLGWFSLGIAGLGWVGEPYYQIITPTFSESWSITIYSQNWSTAVYSGSWSI